MKSYRIVSAAVCLLVAAAAVRADDPPFTRSEDVIYGRKHGMALTLDVFTPKEKANGAAIVFAVSGGWFSSHDHVPVNAMPEYVKRGYTVFAVVHGSQPKFTIPECVADMNRAVRFIRAHAADYKIDPQRIGITGGSAGGHLSLMLGTAGSDGDEKALDPINRASSRVQCVACLFPPTDFLNYGKTGEIQLGRGILANFRAPFDFQEFDNHTKEFERIEDVVKILDIARQISPIYHVTPDDPPTLIIHGDADTLVPLQQAQTIIDKLKEAGVTAELIVKQGAGHGGEKFADSAKLMADWFDKHLTARPAEAAN